MDIYEKQYQELQASGAEAWTGDGYQRAKAQQQQVFAWLSQQHYLPQPGATILELGCGNGAMAAHYFALRGDTVWGVDFAPTAIEWAKARFTQAGLPAHFFTGDVCHLPQCDDAMFDLIVDGSCLHCLIGDARQRCLAEVRRLLKPTGYFVISSMCGLPRYAGDIAAYDSDQQCLLRQGQAWRTLKPLADLLEEVQNAQFVVHASQVNENPWWDHATIVCSAR